MPKKPIRVSTDNVLYRKAPEGVYPIEESDWKRIKTLAKGIKCPKKILELLGAACWGVSGSALIQCICYYIQLEDKSKWHESSTIIMFIVFIVFLILGLLLFLLDKEKNFR